MSEFSTCLLVRSDGAIQELAARFPGSCLLMLSQTRLWLRCALLLGWLVLAFPAWLFACLVYALGVRNEGL